jgi:putative transposase
MVQRKKKSLDSSRHLLRDVGKDEWDIAARAAKALRPTLTAPLSRERAEIIANTLGVSSRTVLRWRKRMQISNEVTTLVSSAGFKPGRSRLPAAQFAIVQEIIGKIARIGQAVRIVDVVEEVTHRCRGKRIKAPDRRSVDREMNRQIPHLIVRRVNAEVPNVTPAPGKFVVKRPLEVVQIDHTPIDVIVVDDLFRIPLGRPYLSVALDVATRCVLAFLLSFEAPSSATVAVLLCRVVGGKTQRLQQIGLPDVIWPMTGIPKMLHLDNAAEFHSDALKRGCAQYEIELEYRPLARPHFGGHIERLIGTLMSRVSTLPGATGANTKIRKRKRPEDSARLTLMELERWLTIEIAQRYHNDTHTGLKGGTPAGAWSSLKGLSRPVKDLIAFHVAFLPGSYRTVQRSGIRLHHIDYWHDGLIQWIGRKQSVYVQWDPADLSRLMVTLPDKTFLQIPYATLSRPTVSLWELSAASTYIRKASTNAITEAMLFNAVEKQRNIIRLAKQETRRVNTKQVRTHDAPAQRPVSSKSPLAPPHAIVPEPKPTAPSAGVDYSKPAESYPVEIWFPDSYERP